MVLSDSDEASSSQLVVESEPELKSVHSQEDNESSAQIE